jgi:hypothetical protein
VSFWDPTLKEAPHDSGTQALPAEHHPTIPDVDTATLEVSIPLYLQSVLHHLQKG